MREMSTIVTKLLFTAKTILTHTISLTKHATMRLSIYMLLFLIILIIEVKTFAELSTIHPAVVLAAPEVSAISAKVIPGRVGIDVQPPSSSTMLQDLTLTNSLTVLGSTLFGATSIAGGLTLDGSLALGARGLQSLGDTLYLQENKLAPIDMMGGLLRINTDGLVTIADNLNVQGVLGASTIVPIGSDVTVDLTRGGSNSASFGGLLVIGSASFSGNIEASGTATFARTVSRIIETSKLIFTPSEQSGSVGFGTISAGFTAIKILTNALTPDSRVFVTPVSVSTQPISVTNITPGTSTQEGVFTVETATPVLHDLDFNWFIVN